MSQFRTFDGITLHYSDQGVGDPVILLHGMAADGRANFEKTGIIDAVLGAGRRAIALDMRGHGYSDSVDDPARFEDDAIRQDVVALIDHLELERVTILGYSMSGFLALRVAAAEPRVDAVALIGIGTNLGAIDGPPEVRTAYVDMIENPVGENTPAEFRIPGALRGAVIAYMKATWPDSREAVPHIHVPVLMIVGERDRPAGDPTILAGQLDAELVRVPGNHFTALDEPALHEALGGFLSRAGDGA